MKRGCLLMLALCCFWLQSIAQTTLSQSFDASTFVPSGWSIVTVSSGANWSRSTSTSHPSGYSPHSGAGLARFNSWSYSSGERALRTPAFSLEGAAGSTLHVTFWILRESGYNSSSYNDEGITVLVNTSGSLSGATSLGYVPRRRGYGISGGVTGVSTPSSNGWYQYTCTIPSTFLGPTNYLFFKGKSRYGNDIYIDDITWDTYPAPPTPTITAAPTSLSFGGVLVGSSSAVQSFTFSGTHLASAPGDVTVTAPSHYQVSLEGTLWFTSLTFPYTSATLGSNTVYVRFNPTAVGTESGSISISGGTASESVAVTGNGANACTGTPTAGTAVITPTSGAGGTTFNLSLTGSSSAGGLTYQWQSATGTSFTDIAGATNPTYSFSGLSETTHYQCVVTCPSFASATSSSVTATYTAPTYCSPSYGSASSSCYSYSMYSRISSLTGETGSINDGASCNGSGYLNRTSLSCTVLSGTAYSTHVQTGYSCCMSSQIWIDFNDDGTFASSESVGGSSSTYGSSGSTYNITIPSGANPGTHRMRIVGNYSSCCGGTTYPSLPACITSSTSYGETRDYSINVVPPCSTPPDITGINYVCFPGTTTLDNSATGGTWTSSNPSVATVSSSGVVSGVSGGASIITYTVPGGCKTTRVVGVYAKPSVASVSPSATTLCGNTPLTLTAGTTSGPVASYNWSGPGSYSSTSATGTITFDPPGPSASGEYSLTVTSMAGCVSDPVTTSAITVLTPPAPFTGSLTICEAATSTLGNTETGGTWTSGAMSIATVDGTSGDVTGVSAGLVNITYTLPNSCFAYEVATVNPLPGLTFSPASSATVCIGDATSITAVSPNPTFAILSQDFNSGLSGWSISGTGGAANIWQITSSPGIDGTPGDGTPMMQAAPYFSLVNTTLTSASFSTLGYGSADLTFNQYLISDGTDVAVKVEYSVNGGAWSTLADQTSMIAGSPVWASSSPEFSIALPSDALNEADVRLRWTFDGASFYWIIDNVTVTAALPASTFAWSGPPGLSCTTCDNPTITPTTTGANAYSVAITSSAGCVTNDVATVNVNPLPGIISGNLSLCVGSTFMLGNSVSGGSWSSGTPGVASVDASSGAVTGISEGTAEITYSLPTSCYRTAVVTVGPMPAAISGTASVCEGQMTTLTHPVSGGSWSSSATATATVSAFGVVSGLMAGNANITYTLPSGCTVWHEATVNSTPAAISGTAAVCQMQSSSLSDGSAGGFWSSSDATVASVDGTGLVTGGNDGVAIISYTLPTMCYATQPVTVNAVPNAITGATNVCQGSMATVVNTSGGGTWSSTNPAVAVVNASGDVTGYTNGVVGISYTFTSTGCSTSVPFTVNALPADIGGITEVCQGDMTALLNTTPGGTWTSSNVATLSVDPSSGVATGGNAGIATVTYTLSTGCKKTTGVTVNALPENITGTGVVCENGTTTLFDFTPGGVWSSGSTAVADVSATGEVTGNSAGLAQISYTLPATGCYRTTIATVNPRPATIIGSSDVCFGASTTMSDPTPGGTWSSSGTAIATVDPSTGTVTGTGVGSTNINYTLATGCARSQMIQVNALPNAIVGSGTVCEEATTALSSSTPGGVWSTNDAGTATVNAAGMVTGISSGTTDIIYTLTSTGCSRSRSMMVNETPSMISGTATACLGSASTLTSTPSGGHWSSASAITAAVNDAGVVNGLTQGATDIVYMLPNGCSRSTGFTVNPLPAAIGGTMQVCEASTTTLTNTSGGGLWSSTAPSVASVDNITGMVSGGMSGTATIIYTLPTSCARSTTVTVNPLPAPIAGVLNVCSGSSTPLSNATGGGAWSSSNTSVAGINAAGVAVGGAAGVAVISYTLPTSCRSVASIVVNPLPAAISGTMSVCKDDMTVLSTTTAGGTWGSNNPAVASVDGSGVVTGISAGSAQIAYTLSTGCKRTANLVVNPLPASIVGNTSICQGSTTILGNTSGGGSWSSSDASVAPITASGLVSGANVGFSIITYTLPTGCKATTSVIVNGNPDGITGTMSVCAGDMTTLDNTTGGGTWTASNSRAAINSMGEVTGVATGTTRITYTTGNNCYTTAVVTVNPLPSLLAGPSAVCPGETITWTNASPMGAWTSDNTAVADVDVTTGVISGTTSGSASITYMLPTGCMRSRTVTVHDAVEAITGTMDACVGTTTTLADATTGGAWISGNTSVATVNSTSGEVSGVSDGTALITYAMTTGCKSIATVMINALPSNITGAGSVCAGATAMVADATAGGSWSSSDVTIATVDATGTITGLTPGTASVVYTLPTGCSRSRSIDINAVPIAASVTGGGSYCAGGMGVSVGIDGSETGAIYTLSNGGATIATLTGTGAALDFGMQTAAGNYLVQATTSAGCNGSMTGSATITISPLVTPSVSLVADMGDTVCAGTLTTFTATGMDGGSSPAFSWEVNGTAVGATGSYAYTPANGDMVTVTYTSSETCASPLSVSAGTVMTAINNETPAVTIMASPKDTVCQGEMATYTASWSNGGDSPAFTWIVGGTIDASASGPTYSNTPANGQSVVCRLNSNFGCLTANDVSSNMITMHVDSVYIPQVEIVASPGTVVSANQEVTFTTTVMYAGPSPRYQWLINNTEVPGATLPVFTHTGFNDGDSVTCRVWGSGDCGKLSINAVVMETSATGVATTQGISDVRLVPNPNNGTFMLKGSFNGSGKNVAVEVTNMLGQVVYRGQAAVNSGQINERVTLDGSLANGMYLLNLTNGTEHQTFHFVLKQ